MSDQDAELLQTIRDYNDNEKRLNILNERLKDILRILSGLQLTNEHPISERLEAACATAPDINVLADLRNYRDRIERRSHYRELLKKAELQYLVREEPKPG